MVCRFVRVDMNGLATEFPSVSSVSYHFVKNSQENLKPALSHVGAHYHRLEVSKKSLEILELTSRNQICSSNLVT